MIETAYRDRELVPPLAGYRGFTLAEPLEATLSRVEDADQQTFDSEVAHILDVGSLWLQVPEGARLQSADETGDPCSVQLILPSGRVTLSVLVAPEDGALWPEMADEIASARNDAGATVSSEQGDWGQEVAALSNGELSWFIGMDGPGWMLYGVAAGPEERSSELGDTLRELMRDSVVSAALTSETWTLPVRTALPLSQPEPAPLAEPVELFRDPMEPRKPLDDQVPMQDWMPTQWAPPKRDLAAPARVAVNAVNAPTEPTLGEPGWLTEPEWVTQPGWLTAATPRHAKAFGSRRPVPAGMSALIAGAILVLGTAGMLVIASGTKQQPVAAADIAGEPATALTISRLDPTAPTHHVAEHPPIIAPVVQNPQAKAPAETQPAQKRAAPAKSAPAVPAQSANHSPAVAGAAAPTANTAKGHKPATSSNNGTAGQRAGSESHGTSRSHGGGRADHSPRAGTDSDFDDDFDSDFDGPDLIDGLTGGLLGGIG